MARDRPSPYVREGRTYLRVFHKSRNVAVPGPRAAVKKTPTHHVGRWENLSLAMRLAVRPHPPCSSGSPDPDPFVIRRAQTTAAETHIVTMDLAGDRPRNTIKNAIPHRRARDRPSPSCVHAHSNARGGQAPALRENRDRRGFMKHPHLTTKKSVARAFLAGAQFRILVILSAQRHISA